MAKSSEVFYFNLFCGPKRYLTEDYDIDMEKKPLGKGASATVYSGVCKKTDTPVAIKRIGKKAIWTDKKKLDRVKQEVKIHFTLEHPSILKVFDCYEDAKYVYLVMEYCHNGDIGKYLQKYGNTLNEDEARIFMYQVVDGLLYLHKNRIIHRDIKLANLLLTKDMHVKIADFGLATVLKKSDDLHDTMCGTPNYLSPEMVTGKPHGLPTDLWSLGVMLYVCLVGRPPFESEAAEFMFRRVERAKFELPENLSSAARNLVQRLLCKNPENRISLIGILKHKFMEPYFLNIAQQISEMSVDSGRGTITLSRQNFSHTTSSNDRNQPVLRQPVRGNMPIQIHNQRGQSYDSMSSGSDGNSVSRFGQSSPLGDWYPPSPPVRERDSQNEDELQRTKAAMRDTCNYRPRLQNTNFYSGAEKKPAVFQGQVQRDHAYTGKPGLGSGVVTRMVGATIPQGQDMRNQVFDPSRYEDSRHDAPARLTGVGTYSYSDTPNQRSGHMHRNIPACSSERSPAPRQHSELSNCSPCNLEPIVGQGDGSHNFAKNASDIESASRTVGQRQHKTQTVSSDPANLQTHEILSQVQNCLARDGPKSIASLQQAALNNRLPVQFSSPEVPESRVRLTEKEAQNCLTKTRKPFSRDNDNCTAESESLGAPISTLRLLPCRQKTSNVVVHIMDNGNVCLEFIKRKEQVDMCVEVLKISPDGKLVQVYRPSGGKGVPITDCPPPPPEKCKTFEYPNIPKNYVKKYQYAARFIGVIRSKTPKVTMYTHRAKCMLMENLPYPDFTAEFYDGAKFSSSARHVKIIETDGTSLTLDSTEITPRLSKETRDILEYVQQCRDQCVKLEQVISSVQSSSPGADHLFPVLVGRRPKNIAVSRKSTPCSPTSESNFVQNAAFEGTLLSSTINQTLNTTAITAVSSASSSTSAGTRASQDEHQRSRVIQKTHVPNIGWITQMANGDLWADFQDGTRMGLGPGEVTYVSEARKNYTYNHSDRLPEVVEDKLHKMRLAVNTLKTISSSGASSSSSSR